MTLAEDVFAALTTGSPLPLRVYPDVLPSNVVLPAITYLTVAGTDDFHLLGRSGLERLLIRIEVWSTIKLTAEEVMEQQIVPMMLAASTFTVNGIERTAVDGEFEEDTERYRASREFIVWRAD